MRFFIALEIPDESKSEIVQVQQKLAKIFPNIHLTDVNKLHLTLAFIGEKPDKEKEALIKMLEYAVHDIPPFEIVPAYVDAFPNIHYAQTFWIAVKGDTEKLMIIHERIKDGLLRLQLDADFRRFIPHIAIAKGDHEPLKNSAENELFAIAKDQFKPILINSIKLFESTSNHGFHDHNTLAEIKLK